MPASNVGSFVSGFTAGQINYQHFCSLDERDQEREIVFEDALSIGRLKLPGTLRSASGVKWKGQTDLNARVGSPKCTAPTSTMQAGSSEEYP